MAYILDGLTLPRPIGFKRKPIEIGRTITTLAGTTKRDVTKKKYQYELEFERLTTLEINNIVNKYELNTALDFQVTETNLSIATTSVLMNISNREYNTKGSDYREDISIILTEVS